MKKKESIKFISECGKIILMCDNDVALGDLHDQLMALKGYVVDRMVAAQKEEEAVSEAHKQKDENEQNTSSGVEGV